MKKIETLAGNSVQIVTGSYYRHSRPQITHNTEATKDQISLNQMIVAKNSFGIKLSVKTTEKAAASLLNNATKKAFRNETVWKTQLAR